MTPDPVTHSSANPKNILNRIDALLCLRGLACLMVVAAHCNPPKQSIIYQSYDLTWIIFSGGGVAVKIFFCLSGYLMGKAFYTGRYSVNYLGIVNFWRNRVLRIFPLYYFATLIFILFVYPASLKFENWLYLLRICTFTYNPTLPINFNGAFWTLSTEVQFYLIVPFIYIYFKHHLKKLGHVIFTALAVIVVCNLFRYGIWIAISSPGATEVDANFVRYISTPLYGNFDLFLGGFLVNALLVHQQKYIKDFLGLKSNSIRTVSKYFAILLVGLLYIFTAYNKYQDPQRMLFVLPTLTALVTSLFIFIFEFDAYESFSHQVKLSFDACLRNPLRVMEIFGNLTYGIYIWHFPILTNITPIVTASVPLEAFFIRFAVTVILSMLLSAVTYYTVENPAARLKIYNQSSNEINR